VAGPDRIYFDESRTGVQIATFSGELTMKRWMCCVALAMLSLLPARAAAEDAVLPLRVVYVGNSSKPRASAFARFLKKHFTQATVIDSAKFDPAAAKQADVVLFDWAQSDGDLAKGQLPLGRFEDWSKPTVLLNSAGLFVAGQWQLIGGAG
jgi:hypothetical protein